MSRETHDGFPRIRDVCADESEVLALAIARFVRAGYMTADVACWDAAYDAAEREDAEEAYGDVQLVLDAGADRLVDVRDAYAATLDEDAAAEYAHAFGRAAGKRFPRLTGLL